MRLVGVVARWVVAAGALVCTSAHSQAPVPRALEEWQAWVLKGREFHRCPFLAGSNPAVAGSYRCAWPERLTLNLDAHGGSFTQRWQVYTDSWIGLPGDLLRWPEGVLVDGRAAAVVARDGIPQVRLGAGAHQLSGRFAWATRPESLTIPAQTALLDLDVDGRQVQRPQRDGAALALGRQSSSAEPRQLEVQIYRLVQDDIPLRLLTRLRLRVAGDAREELLARVLPEGFIPVSLEGELPARLEPDGRLRVQVRAGRFELLLDTRQAQPSATLPSPLSGPVRDEVWSFAVNDRLRVAAVEGVAGIDPLQANVPQEWRGYPAFRMQPGLQLKIVERSRGLANMDQNRLRLSRRLWLDFDHEGFTAVDQLSGTLRRDWRLSMRDPYELASARSGGEWLLVTSSAAQGESGVELRTPSAQLVTLSRSSHPFSALPATGWTSTFEGVSGELFLPPGHRLLAVLGADESPTAWLDRWGLWSLFGVLIVVVFTYWVAGAVAAAVAAAGLLLTYQAEPGFIWGWGNLLAAIALAGAAPPGRMARAASLYRTASFALLGVALVPFMWTEVRHAIYPQLEVGGYEVQPLAKRARLEMPQEEAKTLGFATGTPPAAPSPAASQEILGGSSVASVAVTADRLAAPESATAARYAPGTLFQAGPGIPAWNYGANPFGWSGPVEPDQTVRFVVLGPLALALWRIAGVVLLALLFIRLARASFGARPGVAPSRWWGGATAGVLLALIVAGSPSAASAQSTPDSALLNELRDRLTDTPPCTPTCAEIMRAQVRLNEDRIQIELQASALAPLAVAMPSAGDRWRVDSVAVDGASALALAREPDEALWIPLKSGAHAIRIEGRLLGDSLQLAFPAPPRTIAVDAAGWDVAGVTAERLVSGAVDLTRRPRAGTPTTSLTRAGGEDFPAFVRVVRDFRLDLDWSITTTLERVAPPSAAFTVVVPLVPGESVLTEGVEVREGVALVGFAAGQAKREWTSALAHRDALSLRLDATPPRAEIWRFTVSPQWRVAFSGPPAVLPENLNSGPWVFEYRPQVGEHLDLSVTRPRAVPGRTLAIDAVRQSVTIGLRASDHELDVRYRSTEGGRHTIQLPKDAVVKRVTVDGSPTQIRPDGGELPLSILPGEHAVSIAWASKQGESMTSRPDAVDLRAPSANVTSNISLPADRWPLTALGGGVGPAFLYWGELLVFIVIASVLGRWPRSPLRTSEWLLLGLGLSTLSWSVLVTVAVWLFAMRWREDWRGAYQVERWQFNLLQCALAALTLLAVTSLVFSGVRYGLLASPDMGVAGPGSGEHTFSWFVDRTASAVPRPAVYSLPLWVYRTIMFAWALWIALALARWLRFAWQAWSSGALWRGELASPPVVRPAP